MYYCMSLPLYSRIEPNLYCPQDTIVLMTSGRHHDLGLSQSCDALLYWFFFQKGLSVFWVHRIVSLPPLAAVTPFQPATFVLANPEPTYVLVVFFVTTIIRVSIGRCLHSTPTPTPWLRLSYPPYFGVCVIKLTGGS